MHITEEMYAVMCVDISDGSNYKPKLIEVVPAYAKATVAAVNYMKSWLKEMCPQKSLEHAVHDGTANFALLHAYDVESCFGIQLSIQKIQVNIDTSTKVIVA